MHHKLRPEIIAAVEAAQGKQASDIAVLDLSATGAFSQYFLLCSGHSQPQLRAIADAIEGALHRLGVHLSHHEGKASAEWVLLDYGFFIAHIFTPRAREYYDLERLWRDAGRISFSESNSLNLASGRADSASGIST